MDRKELIKKYIEFFKSKGHSEIKNSSLIPENDPTVLFTTAGMHPLVPFLLGSPHPQGKRLVNVQRCIRTGDIDEVGDSYHHTFFEMLGNWSLGDYYKSEAIEYTFEFLTKVLGIPLERFAVSVFAGDDRAIKDDEATKIWKKLGVSEKRIAYLNDNWWQTPSPGPCGTDTEMFYWKPNDKKAPAVFNPSDKNWVEIGNDVLMGFTKSSEGKYSESKQKNIDFGGGVERIITALNGLEDNYEADMWKPLIEKIENLSKKKYSENKKEMRIITDHIKASVFLIADGIKPSNTLQGYVLRRLIRRAIRQGRNLNLTNFVCEVAKPVFEIYSDYEILKKPKEKILLELKIEEEKFNQTLEEGLRVFKKITDGKKILNGKDAFLLYQSYGFPIEILIEEATSRNISVDEKGFQAELSKHQELSRTASAGTFKSGLADNSTATTKLHTATHLLNEALRRVLNKPDLHQKGSNITPERTRFDFTFDRKLTAEEIKKVEDMINEIISKGIPVKKEILSLEEAKKSGAAGVFDSKYGEKVFVFTVGDFSKEICTGPHVENTKELGHFKIQKEESSSSGVRRIKAVLE